MKVVLATAMYYPEADNGAKVLDELHHILENDNEFNASYIALAIPQKVVNVIIVDKSQNIFKRYVKFINQLLIQIEEGDIIINNFSFFTGFCILILSLFKDFKLINYFGEDEISHRTKSKSIKRGNAVFYKEKFISLCLALFLKMSSIIVTHSEELKELLQNKYKIKPSKIVICEPLKVEIWYPYELDIAHSHTSDKQYKKFDKEYLLGIINNRAVI